MMAARIRWCAWWCEKEMRLISHLRFAEFLHEQLLLLFNLEE
jgi:hypothetical protein